MKPNERKKASGFCLFTDSSIFIDSLFSLIPSWITTSRYNRNCASMDLISQSRSARVKKQIYSGQSTGESSMFLKDPFLETIET
eukprot:CAMPEP_0116148016 /NCGR_PEP_ID=MMETSP0329-20121206/18097_1 /TAXON_ID=697910 /ORGANISM="Pseudo-nitzschia arenysensis, Strain B593" /LENGTH=83 /DNA_ID=CAMNT_0003644051 /DNA_START=489 /DNA_END=736 /DNA_ORIENTATION=+